MKSIFKMAIAFAMAATIIHSESEAKALLSAPTQDWQKVAKGTDSARCVAVLMIEADGQKEEDPEIKAAIEKHKRQAIFFLKERAIPVFTDIAKKELDYFTRKDGLTASEFQKWLGRVEHCIDSSVMTAEPTEPRQP